MVSFLLSSVSKSLIYKETTKNNWNHHTEWRLNISINEPYFYSLQINEESSKLKAVLSLSVSLKCWSRLSHLLHEEVVHAPVVIGAGEDLQGVVLPLSWLQSGAADLHTAPPLHLGRRLFVLLQVFEPLIRGQVRTTGWWHVLLPCSCYEKMSSLVSLKRLFKSRLVLVSG